MGFVLLAFDYRPRWSGLLVEAKDDNNRLDEQTVFLYARNYTLPNVLASHVYETIYEAMC